MVFVFLAVIIVLAFMFVPVIVEMVMVVDGLLVSGKIRLRLFGLLHFKIVFFNVNNDLLRFFYKRKHRQAKKIEMPKDKQLEKIESITKSISKSRSFVNQGILKAIKIKESKVSLEIGLKQRADVTALSVGFLQIIIFTVFAILGVQPKNIKIAPNFSKNIFKAEIKCILTITIANIIFKGIKNLFRRN